MTDSNLYKFEPIVKYSSNSDYSLAILSVKSQSAVNFLPEFTPIKIINPTNNKFTICKIGYASESNIKTNSIYLSKQTIQSLKIPMFKKITLKPIESEINVNSKINLQSKINKLSQIFLTPVNTLDYRSFTQGELWENFIKPYFFESIKICTIGDILILNSHNYKVKFIVDKLVNLDGDYMVSGCVSPKTQIYYISQPINSINEFYDSNEFIKYQNDTRKFEIIYDFDYLKSQKNKKKNNNLIILNEIKEKKDSFHYFAIFTIGSGLVLLYMFDIFVIGLFLRDIIYNY